MRTVVVAATAGGILGLAAACGGATATSAEPRGSSPASHVTTAPAKLSRTPRPAPMTSKQICDQALRPAVLLAWAPGAVAEFRAYQYGGPKPTVPLAHAFGGLPGPTRGAWCATKAGAQATHWWAVVVGHKPASVITIHGPGEGVVQGAVAGPTRVP